MAGTEYGTNAPEAVKLWSKKLAREVLKETYIGKFIGRSDNSLVQLRDDASKGAGDRVRITLRNLLDGDGVLGDAPLEGNEEALTTYTDDVVLNQVRHAVRSAGKMSEQRIPFAHREEAMQGLRDWFAQRLDRNFFLHAAGFAGGLVTEHGERYRGDSVIFTGGNLPTAPSAARHTRADSAGFIGISASDEDIGADDTFTLTDIDGIVAVAETASPVIRPIRYKGENVYVMFLHPYQARDLRSNTNAGQWQDIQKAAMQGGKVDDNPIFRGALGMYNNVILHVSSRIPQGVNSSTGATISTVRRSVLCGAQSIGLSFGQGHSFNQWEWHEELFDYGNALGVSAGCIYGMKKLKFNSVDFGTIVYSTYAAA